MTSNVQVPTQSKSKHQSTVQMNVPSVVSLRESEKTDDMLHYLKSSLKVLNKEAEVDQAPVLLRRKSRMLPVYTKSDSSVYPSYTNLILPYRVVCRQRYRNAINQHHEQFIKEIRLHERLQPYALGGVRLRREFCDPILDRVGQRDIITLTIEEKRRLEHILKVDPKEL